MGQDIKDLLKNDQLHIQKGLPDEHEARFLQWLEEALPIVSPNKTTKKGSFFNFKVAAAVIILVTIGALMFQQLQEKAQVTNTTIVDTETNNKKSSSLKSLGDISPDLKKIEDYYVANINYELTQVEVSQAGKQLFDSYMEKLSQLNEEQKVLQQELTDIGPNEQTINAMIDNLQFRLKLLYQLKEKLNELKQSENEV
ncbi:hypothetical protein [Kordia zhangzhouensis]|uniref:hypothetical protein n=1 Tax=Kordia zhangzhouensis TaxID=1620405 RepID=UPI0006293B15|nr:hypothetical protein [Kordia zhangzhouensis]